MLKPLVAGSEDQIRVVLVDEQLGDDGETVTETPVDLTLYGALVLRAWRNNDAPVDFPLTKDPDQATNPGVCTYDIGSADFSQGEWRFRVIATDGNNKAHKSEDFVRTCEPE